MSKAPTPRPRATVVIPTLNAGPFLPDLLPTILEQRPQPPVEVIILDSGSTDNTRAVADSFGGVWVEDIQGVSRGYARNLGVRLAQVGIIVFLSQEAMPADDSWLAKLVEPFMDPNVSATFPQQVPPGDAGPTGRHLLSACSPVETIVYAKNHGDETPVPSRDVFLPDACSAVRRSAFFSHPFDESLIMGEDLQFVRDAVMSGRAVVCVPDSIVVHSHSRSFGQTLGRHFDNAYALSKIYPQSGPRRGRGPGGRFLTQETRVMVRGRPALPPWHLANVAAKSTGALLGPFAEKLPRPVVRRISLQPDHWTEHGTPTPGEKDAAAYPYRNIYHCCTVKSASQWFRSLFRARPIRRCVRMAPCHWSDDLGVRKPLNEEAFAEPFPARTVAESLYIRFAVFESIPKPGPWKAFYLLRDPRDVLVSWYYSLKCSHQILDDTMAEQRRQLESASKEDGLIYAIGQLSLAGGLMDAQRSWVLGQEQDERVKVCRYEEMFGPREAETFADLMAFLEIPLSGQEQSALLDHFSFDKFSGGRKKGEPDECHHYRSGTSGGWKQEFTDRVREFFAERTGDLVQVLGYEPTFPG